MFDRTIVLFGTTVNLAAQIFGFAMLVFLALGYLTHGRAYFVLTLLGSVCCVMESLVLKAWSSAFAAVMVCVRNLFIIYYGKKGGKVPPAICWTIIACVGVMGVASTVFIEKDVWSLLPPALTIADSFFATLRPEKELKIALIPIAFGYTLFNYHVGAYVGSIRQIIAFTVSVAGYIKYKKYLAKKQSESSFAGAGGEAAEINDAGSGNHENCA